MSENDAVKPVAISAGRAARCMTHHHACDCREHDHAATVAALQAEVAAHQATIERLRFVGGRMSNVCFNLAQDSALPERTRKVLDSLRREWDDELRSVVSTTKDQNNVGG